jgi:DNA end-binding protein Ku
MMPSVPRKTTRKPSPREARKTAPSRATSRSLWTGSIGFGLVQIPVRLYARERPSDLAFHEIDRRDHALVGYERINKETHKPVAWGDIARAYEIRKGEYVIMTDEDFAHANVKASQTIEIQDFVDAASIQPAFFERPYFVLPDKRGERAHAVLHQVMAKRGLAAIGLLVLRSRQHLCAVMPEGDSLALDLLRFDHELRPASELPAGATGGGAKPTSKELSLAEDLVDRMVVDWDPSKYKDAYRDDLLDAIRQKAKTGTVEPRNVPEEGRPEPIDLVRLLQRSVEGAKGSPKKKEDRKRASSVG